ncbi:MAG TPA: alpha/beta fold hydrolase [Kofleriaceae bacterium]|nr:alpha/beta fold hydrolase [Kofleriaceae bacterium]
MKRALALALLATPALAAPTATPAPTPTPTPPAPPIAGKLLPVSGDFAIKDFTFASGEKLPELRIHYMTLGTARKDARGHISNAVIVMHGTGGSGQQFLRPQFAETLYGPGQPLDLTKYFVILPDDIGHGGSSKPSDGMHARFPHYGYKDMVAAEHALVVDGLQIDHLRLVMGTSMGCMHSWMWLEQWPAMMDAAMPLACLPTAIAGRNRAWRKIAIDAIEQDPAWNHGEYKQQPRAAMMTAYALLTIAGSSPLADQKRLATRDAVDRDVAATEARFAAERDANDLMYQLASSSDYDPSAELERITAPVVLVNSSDDFINPPELGLAEKLIKRVKRGKYVLIPASEATHGHGTHTWGAFWAKHLQQLLDATAKQ